MSGSVPFTVRPSGELKVDAFCMARCCEAFHMSQEHLGWLKSEPENVRDGLFIRDMLIPLTDEQAQAIHRAWTGFERWTPEPGESYFTCKHWDRSSRLCTAYQLRPQMCRDYGTTQPCRHGCGCGVG